MPSLIIPKREYDAIQELIGIDDATFNSFAQALEKNQATLSLNKFVQSICEHASALKKDTAKKILRFVISLYGVRYTDNISPEVLADAVCKAAEEISLPEFQFDAEKAAILKTRIVRLLNYDKSVGVTAKAGDVLTEHQKIFCSARILSDIRPIFTWPLVSISGAVLIHMLQIAYHEDGDHKEFYVALDTLDLQKLKEVINRAEQKTKSIEDFLKKSELNYLPVE